MMWTTVLVHRSSPLMSSSIVIWVCIVSIHVLWTNKCQWRSLATRVCGRSAAPSQLQFLPREHMPGGLGSRNSVRLSVTRVHCDKSKWRTADILISHERAITLLLWHQQWLLGDASFPLKSALKVTHPLRETPLRQISAYNVSAVGDSEKTFNYDEYKVDHGLSNEP